MATISDVLRSHGMQDDESDLADALDQALRRAHRASLALPAAERALLEKGGLRFGRGAQQASRRAARDGAAAYLRLLATSLTVPEAAARIGVDQSRVRHRIAARQLFAIADGGARRLPAWQFETADGRPLPGLAAVLAAIPADAHPLSVSGFFETPQPELVLDETDESPLSPAGWLAAGGDPALVAALAASAFTDT